MANAGDQPGAEAVLGPRGQQVGSLAPALRRCLAYPAICRVLEALASRQIEPPTRRQPFETLNGDLRPGNPQDVERVRFAATTV